MSIIIYDYTIVTEATQNKDSVNPYILTTNLSGCFYWQMLYIQCMLN